MSVRLSKCLRNSTDVLVEIATLSTLTLGNFCILERN
jgi:hypothetical protein